MARGKSWLLGLVCAGAAGVLLFCSPWVGEGMRRGLAICATVMIPSLFPFLILSDFVARTQVGRMLERPLGGVAKHLYHCPPQLAPAILMSWIGGYPAGARVLAGMVEQKRLSPQDAGRALAFCVNSGPAFLVAVVGAGVFRSPGWGLFLFGCQLAAGAVTGRILCRRPVLVRGSDAGGTLPPAAGLVRAVSSATAGMLSICAFVLVFSALCQVLEEAGLLAAASRWLSRATGGVLTPGGASCLWAGFLEIGGGCARAQALPPGQGALVLPFLLSFSSCSVVCQLAACFGEQPVDSWLLLRARLLHGALTALLATPPLWRRFAAVPAMLTGRPVLAPGSGGLLGALCLMAMCAIWLSPVEGER